MQPDYGSPASLLASFSSGDRHTQRFVILTGPSGSGKTTWCFQLAGLALEQGFSTAGLASAAVFDRGRKIGIDLHDLASGEHRPLAVLRSVETPVRPVPSGAPLTTSDWQFFPETLKWGNQILSALAALPQPPYAVPPVTPESSRRKRTILFVDELGPLELERGQGLQAALPLLDARQYELAIAVVRPGLVGLAQARWPWAEMLDISPLGSVQPPEAGV